MGSDELRDTGSEIACEIISAADEGQRSENAASSYDVAQDGLEGRELAAILEALLFVSPEPVPVSRLATAIGTVCEGLNHHPDLLIGWRKVTVTLTTHDAGNKISHKDFDAALRIDALGYPRA